MASPRPTVSCSASTAQGIGIARRTRPEDSLRAGGHPVRPGALRSVHVPAGRLVRPPSLPGRGRADPCSRATSAPVRARDPAAPRAAWGRPARCSPNGIIVGAIVAVNSGGQHVRLPGRDFFAGFLVSPRPPEFDQPRRRAPCRRSRRRRPCSRTPRSRWWPPTRTLTKAQATKIAQMADDGFARAIRPSPTAWVTATRSSRSAQEKIPGDAHQSGQPRSAQRPRTRSSARWYTQSSPRSPSRVGTCNVTSYCELFPQNCPS